MYLCLKQVFKPKNKELIILNSLAYNASKLWNIANYEKKNYQVLGIVEYPNWYEQKARLKDNYFYKNLPSQTAQEILNQLEQAWKSYFTLLKTKGIENPKPPRFKKGSMSFRYLQNAIKVLPDGTLRLSISKQQREFLENDHDITDNYFYLKIKRFQNVQNIKQIEFKPLKNNKYEIVVIYEVADVPLLSDNGKYLSIDLGVNNMLTCYDNTGSVFILGGGRFKEASQYFNKKIAHLQSVSDKQQRAKGVKCPKKTKQVKALYKKQCNIMNDNIHKTTRFVANYCKENKINTVILGDIAGIRDNGDLGKRVNQSFHRIPYLKLKEQLKYKLALFGINLATQKEYYSSQCSPESPEVSKVYAVEENREKRGFYKDGNNFYNADAVGAYNILRLYDQRAKKGIAFPLKGLSNPIKVAV